MQIQIPLSTTAKSYIKSLDFLAAEEEILDASKAGEGNMNVVLRLKSNKNKTYILKQSRPYVEKYPQIAAPQDRILSEIAFYTAIKNNVLLNSISPQIIHIDEEHHVLIMSDLGIATDFMGIYQDSNLLTTAHLKDLMGYLSALHSLKVDDFLPNTEMKQLNHEHIFNFPFDSQNNFDLDTVQIGLASLGQEFKENQELKNKIGSLGEKYLKSGSSLLHGDFYPGSIMQTSTGLKIIDPEFAFMGDPEFDLGVLKAHLLLAGNKTAENFLENYPLETNILLLNAYAGVEILRRILGIAQLPLKLDLNAKKKLCYEARQMIELY